MADDDVRDLHDLVIRGGRVVDPSRRFDAIADVGFRDGLVSAIGTGLRGREVRDAVGRIVTPGLIDPRSRIRCTASRRSRRAFRRMPMASTAAITMARASTVVGLPALALALLYLATRPDLTGPRRIPRWMRVAACMGLAVTLFLTARTFMQLKAVFW